MERLTIRNSDGSVSQPIDIKWAEALELLAAYEDTGLTPEYIRELLADAHAMHDELKRYKEAEKSGRLVVLPTEDFNFTIRGDIALGIIIANCRAFERKEIEKVLEQPGEVCEVE